MFSPPDGGLPLGSIIGVQIDNWRSSNHQAPAHVWLVTADGYSWYDLQFRVLSAPVTSSTTTLKVTLPTALPPYTFTSPASFFLVAGSPGIYQDSAPFQVTPTLLSQATAAPTALPTRVVTPPNLPPRARVAPSPFVFLLTGLTALIALGLVAAVIMLAIRGRTDGRRQAMRQMGLEVEPLEVAATRAAPRPGIRRDTSRSDDRDDHV
jgi:hypothetical protein